MLYGPLLVCVLAFPPSAAGPTALLVIAVTGAFLGQNLAGQKLRGRDGQTGWLIIFASAMGASGIVLVWVYGRLDLVWLALAGLLLFGRQVWVNWSAHKRFERSYLSELLTVMVLALSAPAAYVAGHGSLDKPAWYAWSCSVAFFGSGVLYVKMLILAAREKVEISRHRRWQLGRWVVTYHLLLMLLLLVHARRPVAADPRLLAVAYVPVVVRAIYGWKRMSNQLVSLQRVGIMEIAFTIWFIGFAVAALKS